jgi:Fibronectin type III-like domain
MNSDNNIPCAALLTLHCCRFDKVYLGPGESTTITWALTSDDFKYVGIDSHYILESGEYMLGLGPDADCRGADSTDTSKCLPLSLVTTEKYQPVCEAACYLLTEGVCGTQISDEAQCISTCVKQNWQWNYVDCLEDARESACATTGSSSSNLQCYDPMASNADNTGSTDSDSSSNDTVSKESLSLYLAMAAVSGAIVGVLSMLAINHMRSKGQESGHAGNGHQQDGAKLMAQYSVLSSE